MFAWGSGRFGCAARQQDLDLALGVCGKDLVIGLKGNETSSLGKRVMTIKRITLITSDADMIKLYPEQR